MHREDTHKQQYINRRCNSAPAVEVHKQDERHEGASARAERLGYLRAAGPAARWRLAQRLVGRRRPSGHARRAHPLAGAELGGGLTSEL